jgi:hypothetical protein
MEAAILHDARPWGLGADGQALLEAVLVHLRLLDDFVGSKGQVLPSDPKTRNDDVFAAHWLPTWKPKRVLSANLRRKINRQVAHLSAARSAQEV